jgi:hypothetical protein
MVSSYSAQTPKFLRYEGGQGTVIASVDPAKREALAKPIDAYAEDCSDEFFWALGAQSPTFMYPSSQSKPRPAICLVDRIPEGNA